MPCPCISGYVVAPTARCPGRPSWRSVPSSQRLPSMTRRHCRRACGGRGGWKSHRERRTACSRRHTRAVCTRRRSEKQMGSICLGSCCSRHRGEAQTTLTQRPTAARLPHWSETLRPGCCYAAASEITRTRRARVAAVATRAWLRTPSARCASSSLRSVIANSSGDSSRPTCTPLSSTWGSMKEIYRGAPSPRQRVSPTPSLHKSPVPLLSRSPGTRRSCASSQRSLQRREQRCKRR
jgi:hypothetical protein